MTVRSTYTYQWKPGARLAGDPQRVGETLDSIREAHGYITPDLVVGTASSPISPLHDLFEWRDDLAAQAYRRVQAREVLRSVVVVNPGGDAPSRPTRAFVAVRDELDARIYTSTEVAMRKPDYRQQVLGAARRDLQAFQRKYQDLDELADLMDHVDEKLTELQEQV